MSAVTDCEWVVSMVNCHWMSMGDRKIYAYLVHFHLLYLHVIESTQMRWYYNGRSEYRMYSSRGTCFGRFVDGEVLYLYIGGALLVCQYRNNEVH